MAPHANGANDERTIQGTTSARAQELESLLSLVSSQIIPFVASADKPRSDGQAINSLLPNLLPPRELATTLNLNLPLKDGRGKTGLLEAVEKVLKFSVNTWHPGFMDKLYASTDPVGVASDLLLSVLNTNVHVYQVSPALTVIEKETATQFAKLFGFNGAYAGGLTLPGGSASNWTSMLIARNTLYPETKLKGNGPHRFIVFSSEHGHYSVEKAAVLLGIGSESVWNVKVDGKGRMDVNDLIAKVKLAKEQGFTPFYVNAGAGTTVLGSYDPFREIHAVCREYGLWFHVDGSWGGSVAFSENQKWRLEGAELADSLTVNPHKMLGVPVTCSFLLTNDTRRFHHATSLKAGYLFHEKDGDEEEDVFDMAQMTMGCGRRADSLKLALSWIYYGRKGYQERIDHAFNMAKYFAESVEASPRLHLVSENPPPCLQVCFFYKPSDELSNDAAFNTSTTRRVAAALIPRGFMIDYSPSEHGEFFRAVVNGRTTKEKIVELMRAVEELGSA